MTDTLVDEYGDPVECLDDHGQGECSGAVEYRCPLSGTGRSFPRCDAHWDRRLDEQERIVRTYGSQDSDCAPSWLDPSYAGERWGDDY